MVRGTSFFGPASFIYFFAFLSNFSHAAEQVWLSVQPIVNADALFYGSCLPFS